MNIETEPMQIETATASAVASTPVKVETNNTTITPEHDVDMSVAGTVQSQDLHVETTDEAGNVAFSSSHPNVVSVSSPLCSAQNGNAYVEITAVNIGIATITATVYCGYDVFATVSIEIYVVMDDGVYAVKSMANHLPTDLGDYYLRVQNPEESVSAVVASTHTYGDISDNIYRYWMIEYAGNGEYFIRCLARQEYSLGVTSGNAVIAPGTNEYRRWIIRYKSGGYEIASCGTSYSGQGVVLNVMNVEEGLYNSSYPYYYADASVYQLQDMAFERWSFEPIDVKGVYFRNNSTGSLNSSFSVSYNSISGNSISINSLGYSLVALGGIGVTAPTVTWSATPSSMVTLNSQGTITAVHYYGQATITASITVNGVNYSASYTLYVASDDTGIMNMTNYYIMNYNSGRYLALESDTDANLTNVVTSTRGTQTSKQWRTSRQAGQQYQFVSVYSSANRVLDVTSSNIDIYNDNNASYQMFNIERINSGDYQGCYYIRYQDKYVAQDSNNDVKIVTTPSANAVWSFMAVSKGDAVMYDFDYPDSPYDFDTTGSEYIFTYDFANIGYSVSTWTNATAAHAYTRLQSTDVFVFTGHGAPGLIAFNEDKSTGIGDICANSAMSNHTLDRYINNISDGSLDKLRCVLLMGCNTGNTTETGYNLVDAIYQKGAHFVMGATEIMYIDTDDDFMRYFFSSLKNGSSIYDAYQYVDEKVDNFYIGIRKDGKKDSVRVSVDHYPGYYVGDTKQYLN